MKNQELEKLINDSTKLQTWLFRGIALFLWFGAILVGVMIIALPTEPDEESAKLFVAGFDILFVLVGIYMWRLSQTMPNKVINLLTQHPQTISKAYRVQVQKNGVVAHAVHFKTTDNKKVGMNVSNMQTAERILQLIKQELPHVEVT